ncbi:SusC/RagA family protein [Niastella koreensis]|uniref:TonB-dependent receptor plug n=2 Tax=Niastella koreensis TaxID=354356 RepID=G8TN29_NIAKG|nr:TonB-dependent receptor [Niastella koreensis]AEV97714.1 TonB-dependent receptor plug [Niastella koreensis GR20-10]OQP40466.1 SusC/RagA family protein [Niastella koreensis]
MHKEKTIAFKLMLLVAAILVWQASFAQNGIPVSGTVEDKAGPLEGANVTVTGTNTGTRTDKNGKFSLTVPDKKSTLTISSVGYGTRTVQVGNSTTFHITLDMQDKSMDEIVVIGYGTARKKDLTGATASVSGAEISKIPVTSAAQAITGKIAGVNVVTQSGAPGADINIVVRGGTSITQGNKPLYIVDGFQMDDGLKNIDMNDIETIDVMKDASATAIYGARGSNGVILITTKSGKSGKTQITYNGYQSFEKLAKQLDMMNPEQYADYQYEFQILAGKPDKWAKNFGDSITDPNFYTGASQRTHDTYGGVPGINWQDAMFGGTARLQNHSLSVSGGNDRTKYLLNGSFTGQNGLISHHGFQKENVRFKLNHKINDRVRVDFNTNYNNMQLRGDGSLAGQLKLSLLQPPTGGVRFSNDQLLNTDISLQMQSDDSQYDIYNPIITNDAVTQTKYTRQYTTNAGIEVDVLKNLTWRTQGTFMWQQTRDDLWDDGRTKTSQTYNGPWGHRNNSENQSWQVTNTLNWKKYFGEHNLNVMAGQEVYFSESMKLDNTYSDFPAANFGLNNVAMAKTNYSRASGTSQFALASFFGRVMYSYADRYLLTATLRGDGVSRFAPGKQWGMLPSMSAAWRISEEEFMKDNHIFDQLKLRVGYGTTGNSNIDDYMYVTAYGSTVVYAINNQQVSTLTPSSKLANTDLRWEKTNSFNVGLDLAVLKNRISLSADFYNQQSNNLLLENQIPTSTGYSTQFQNIGSVRNRGFEFVLNTTNINTKEFRWTTGFNISFNRSKVLALYGNTVANNQLIDGNFIVKVGQRLGQFYGYKYDGVYTTDDFNQNANGTYSLKDGVIRLKGGNVANVKPGDIKFASAIGEMDAKNNPVFSTNDRVPMGNGEPNFTGGITNNFAYKGFDLSVFMNFTGGNKVFNANARRFYGPYLPNENTFTAMTNRFRLIDPVTGKETTDLARLAELNPNQYSKKQIWSLHSDNSKSISDPAIDYFLEDGSFLRLNTITLGYTLPHSLLKKAGIANARFYGTLNNLHTFTRYSGYDPEVNNTDKPTKKGGYDDSAYPRSKSIVVGLNLTF